MGRLPRPTGDDLIYHAINRGNNRADVFGPDGEGDMFLGNLARTKARYPFALFGYSWTRSRNGSSSVPLSRNVGPAGDGRSMGNNRPRSWMACGRRCAVAGPTAQRTGSRSFPIASASSVSRAVVVVRHAKRCSDTGILLTPEFSPAKRCSDTGILSLVAVHRCCVFSTKDVA